MSTEVSETAAPATVLIPEAREHQRRRYLRSGVVAVLGALIVAGLVAAVVIFVAGTDATDKAHRAPAPPVSTQGSSLVYFRPVLCFAPPYDPSQPVAASLASPSCTAASLLTPSNLGLSPNSNSPSGFSMTNVAPDSALAGLPSTGASTANPSSTVLLPGLAGSGPAERYVLGPAQMSSTSIASAKASRSLSGQWVVDYSTTGKGTALWDNVAQENFHRLLAIQFDGIVVWAPIIQPTQSSFTSFEGRGEISGGNLNKAEVIKLARAMQPRKA